MNKNSFFIWILIYYGYNKWSKEIIKTKQLNYLFLLSCQLQKEVYHHKIEFDTQKLEFCQQLQFFLQLCQSKSQHKQLNKVLLT